MKLQGRIRDPQQKQYVPPPFNWGGRGGGGGGGGGGGYIKRVNKVKET